MKRYVENISSYDFLTDEEEQQMIDFYYKEYLREEAAKRGEKTK